MKLVIRDHRNAWKPVNATWDEVTLTRAAITQRGREDARGDTYAVVFRAIDGRQFAITGTGLELADLVQAICQASENR